MPSTLVAEIDPAVLTLVGTLTGIVVTAFFGLLTAYLAQRWQFRRTEQEHRLQVGREVREARRETFARYIASAQQVFDRAADPLCDEQGCSERQDRILLAAACQVG